MEEDKENYYEDEWGWIFCKHCNTCCIGYEGEHHSNDCPMNESIETNIDKISNKT